MSGFDVFDDENLDPLDPFGKAKEEEERQQNLEDNAEVTNQDGKITVKSFNQKLAEDEESGANVRTDDGEVQGSFDEENGAQFHARGTKISADTGTALGPVKLSAHGPEADGYGSVGSNKTGLGGHLDAAGVDAQVGDDGTHVKAGVSVGLGLGAEFATGEDSDGDGYGEWGMRGEGGPLSASVRFEPGAVVDGVAEAADAAPGLAQDFADDPEGTLQSMQDAIDEDASARVENASGLRYVRDELGETLGTATDPLGGIAGGINTPGIGLDSSTLTDSFGDALGGDLTDSFGDALGDGGVLDGDVTAGFFGDDEPLIGPDPEARPLPPDAAAGPDEYEVSPRVDETFSAPPGDAYIDPGPSLEIPLEPDSYTSPAPVDDTSYPEPAPMDGPQDYEVMPAADQGYTAPAGDAYVEPGPALEIPLATDAPMPEAPVETYVEPAPIEESYAEPAPVAEESYADDGSLDY